MLLIVAVVVVSAAIGIWAERRFGTRAALAGRRAMLLVLYILLPPVVFFNLARVEINLDSGVGLVLALVSLVVLASCAWVVGAKLLRLTRPEVGALICAVLTVNTSNLGYPVVAAQLGFPALSEAVAYDVLVSMPVLLIGSFGVGAAFGTRAGSGWRERVIIFFTRNPMLYAAIAALIAPDVLAPDVLVDLSRIVMIVAILPLGFFAVGAALAEAAEWDRGGFPIRLDAPVGWAVALRLIGGPILLFLLAFPLIDLPNTYLLLAAMPSGLNTMGVAHACGLDLRIAAGAVAWSTALVVTALAAGAVIG